MDKRNLMQAESRSVLVKGQAIHFLEAGRGKKQLVLFLHGFPCYSGMWTDYLRSLGGDYHAVAIDQLGYNLSSKPKGRDDYRLQNLSGYLPELIQALGHGQAFLVAHDWGGIIAWDALGRFPERFTKAVILNAPHPQIYARLYESDPDQRKKAGYVRVLRMPGAAWLLRWNDFSIFKKGIFQAASRPYSDEEKEGYRSAWKRGLNSPLAYYRSNFADMKTMRQVFPTHVPTLVLWGEKDENLSLQNLKGLDEWATDLRIKRYPEATHWICHDETEAVIRDIRDFFART